MELVVGQKLTRQIKPGQKLEVEIKRLDVPAREAEFMVSGDGVRDPDKPRVMNIFALARWLESLPAG